MAVARDPIAYLLDVPGLAEQSDAFKSKLFKLSHERGFEPSYIAAVISLESGFDPKVKNKKGAPAQGLIQFWREYFPPIAKRAGMKVRWEDLPSLDAVAQLPLVMAYYEGTPLAGRLKSELSATDYYMATFLPAFIGKPSTMVLGKKGSTEPAPGMGKVTLGTLYEQNSGLDANRDGVLTLGDVGKKIEALVSAARERPVIPVYEPDGIGAAGALAIGVALVFFCPSCGARSPRVLVQAEPLGAEKVK